MIQPDSVCMLAGMVITGHDQKYTSESDLDRLLGLEIPKQRFLCNPEVLSPLCQFCSTCLILAVMVLTGQDQNTSESDPACLLELPKQRFLWPS